MTSQELDALVPDGVPFKIRYALANSLQDERLADPDDYTCPYWIHNAVASKQRAFERAARQYDPVPRNRPLLQLLRDYHTKGRKIKARAELKKRVPFAAFAEQQQVLCAFLENVQTDRIFALKLIDQQWDEFYKPFVEKAWLAFGEKEAAKIIVHHFPTEYIVAQQKELAAAYNYLQVRLRLPADAPIDRERLSDSAFLYLSARLGLAVPDDEAERLFYQNMLDAIGTFYVQSPWNRQRMMTVRFPEHSICDAPTISSMIWSLGILGKTDILLRFMDFQKEIYPLVVEGKWEEIKAAFLRVQPTIDTSRYDNAVIEEAVREGRLKTPVRLFESARFPDVPLDPVIFVRDESDTTDDIAPF